MSTNIPVNKTIDPTEWISQAEAARLRGCTRQAISKLIRKQKLTVLEVGGHVLVNRKNVLEFKEGNSGRPKQS